MNEFFRGAVWNLGERYTDVMKTVFVSVFYAQILPTGMFVTCAALALAYAVDKYLLLRWSVFASSLIVNKYAEDKTDVSVLMSSVHWQVGDPPLHV